MGKKLDKSVECPCEYLWGVDECKAEDCPNNDICLDAYLKSDDFDPHIGCPAYPMCDIDPMGCYVKMGPDVEWYGHRD